jgi:hypothetical protein
MINKRLLSLVAAGILVLGLTSLAMAGIPDPNNSTAQSGAGCVDITPGGNGPTLASDGLTIFVSVNDGSPAPGLPIPGYPFQDIWWDDSGTGDLAMCQGGSVADANTGALGNTTISGSAAGGGWTLSLCRVYLAGVAVLGGPTSGLLSLDVNSPDINGDLIVNLVDLGAFSQDFNNPAYQFRSDFTCDGLENLADVGRFAIHNSEVCP